MIWWYKKCFVIKSYVRNQLHPSSNRWIDWPRHKPLQRFLNEQITFIKILTDTGEFAPKWARVSSTRRWIILVAQTRRKEEENTHVHFGANSHMDNFRVLACIGLNPCLKGKLSFKNFPGYPSQAQPWPQETTPVSTGSPFMTQIIGPPESPFYWLNIIVIIWLMKI